MTDLATALRILKNIQSEILAVSRIQTITLGELIDQLEECEEDTIMFDFGDCVPTHFASWRGHYQMLALGYEDIGRRSSSTSVNGILEEAKAADGKTFQGWKGGDYLMNRDTPVWVANPGSVGSTAIVKVEPHLSHTIIHTAYVAEVPW